MASGVRFRLAQMTRLALLLGAALALISCDTGGLLNVEGKGSAPAPPRGGHPSSELVTSGTLARNSQYKLFYTLGQPTPQGVATAGGQRMNGGLTGAIQNQ